MRREFGSDPPLILRKGKELPGTVVREEGCQITSGLVRHIEEKAGEVVCKAGSGGARFGSGAAGAGIPEGAVARCLAVGESIDAAWAERLLLQQSIANT